ncbi:hypothetical protein [Acinetobacter baumannii]|uniref:hypothetical protein n=1 Tax=Acinetobacter baumannii TaxID=470 RepID=UPI002DB6CADA|nr:hypothetical protein [Acinetobacter baumannii]MEB6558761.1 hypothetical protein [Acinetobacter baumannii]
MGSKPKVVKAEDPAETEQKAKELAQKEANENTASRRKQKQSSVLGSLLTNTTALSSTAPKTTTGT